MTDIERRIEILNNTIERYTNLLAKYGNVSTWKNYVKKAEAELNQLKTWTNPNPTKQARFMWAFWV